MKLGQNQVHIIMTRHNYAPHCGALLQEGRKKDAFPRCLSPVSLVRLRLSICK